MNLYLKYRPRTIDELDLTQVRATLSNLVAANSVAHAYLLTGPRGAGKTSTARVLARMVNCEKNAKKLGEPCNECDACTSILTGSAVDVIEIDAASNRGIDDIRELKEKIRLAPAILRKKVYIIDEVHMLTSEAFNALLKTLEEPPSHSLFILCTTELHKVPETIVSRCAQIQFTKATPEEMQRSFARVVAGEGKQVSPEALAYLARSVDGSFRDGVKILDQVLARTDKVEIGDIEQAVSGSTGYKIEVLLQALLDKDIQMALTKLTEATNQGMDLNYLILQLMRGLRDLLVSGQAGSELVKFIFSLDEVARRMATSLDGELLLQAAMIEWCGVESGKEPKNQKIKEDVVKKVEHQISKEDHTVTMDSGEVWTAILQSLGSNNMALDTILSKARPGQIQGDELTIYVQYDFHRQQLMSEKNLKKFEDMITKVVGKPMKIKCEVKPAAIDSRPATSVTSPGYDDTIDDAIAIFSN